MAEEMYTAVEINCETGQVIERPFTEEEIAQVKADEKVWLEQKELAEVENQRISDLKTSAKSKLVLGQPLTEEEAATIIL